MNPLLGQLEQLADDIGRLRRRATSDYDKHLVDRLAAKVEAIAFIVYPTAAEVAQQTYPGDEETIRQAIVEVDARTRRLEERLGTP